MKQVAESLRALIHDLVDYAGLFPPAGLEMTAAVRNYARYFDNEQRLALGRFVVPVARLDEFATLACAAWESGPTWCVSALGSADASSDAALIEKFNDKHAGALRVDVVEMKVTSGDEIARAAYAHGSTLYCEIGGDQLDLLRVMRDQECRAKIRTGGLTPDAFPSAARVAGFIAACRDAEVAFKATAGLHHPVRCERALTYEANSPRGVMHGFVNLFLAAVLLHGGGEVREAERLLLETDARAFHFDDDAATWRGHRWSVEQIREARANFAIAFGSCSYEEPLDDMRALGWM